MEDGLDPLRRSFVKKKGCLSVKLISKNDPDNLDNNPVLLVRAS